jgi:hypothetical protein
MRTILATQGRDQPKISEGKHVPGVFDPKRNAPLFDLETVRNTLTYIRDDMQRMPALERVAELIEAALAELWAAERRWLAPIPMSSCRGCHLEALLVPGPDRTSSRR